MERSCVLVVWWCMVLHGGMVVWWCMVLHGGASWWRLASCRGRVLMERVGGWCLMQVERYAKMHELPRKIEDAIKMYFTFQVGASNIHHTSLHH